MSTNNTPLIRVCLRIIELCKRSGIKKYSSKFHNRLYDNYQFMVLLCLKQKSGVGYKAFIEEELIEWPHAEKVHEFIREVMEALSIIPARNENIPIHKTKGKYRKLMKKGYSKKKYYQRNKNETVNSVVKRKWSDGTLAMNWRNQNKEIIFRLIFYAARRFTSLVFLFFLRKIILPLREKESMIFLEEGFL